MGETDLSEFRTATRHRGPSCWLLTHAFSPTQRRKVLAALDDRTVETSSIARVIRGWGFSVSEHQVGRHRRGDCTCAR